MYYIATNIRYLRTKKGLSQMELCELIGFSHDMVWKWESGRCNPSLEAILILCRVLEVTYDELIGEDLEHGK